MPDDSYGEWMRQHHAKFSTAPELVDRLVTTATRRGVIGRERLLLGEVNEVYRLTLDDDSPLIARISHRDADMFVRGEEAITEARAAGVPVPETVALDWIEVEGDDGTVQRRAVALQRCLPGRPLNALIGDVSNDDVAALILQAGEYLARIHGVRRSARTNRGIWSPPREEWLQEVYEDSRKLGVDTEAIDRALAIAREVADTCDPGEPRLVHSDYSTKHFMVHDGSIVGIIDWDGAGGGHPAIDIEWWDMFFDRDPHPTSLLLEGYRRVASVPENLDVLRVALGLQQACGLIRYYTSTGNTAGAEFAAQRLVTFTDRWDAMARGRSLTDHG